MIARILPPEEWPRLVGTEAELVWPHLSPEARVVVVERDAAIIGCHVLIPYWHVECLWIAPALRGRGTVAGRLWAAVQRVAWDLGIRVVLTAAVDDRVRTLLAHVGATPLPGEAYAVPVRGEG
jgi:hypothetical protein